jgi:hypothetical protein
MNPKRNSQSRTPKARNNAAHTSLQNYFDRVSNSLEDRISEFLLMKKYTRVYEESQKLLEIEKTLNIAAGSIFEINVDRKIDCQTINQSMKLLNGKNLAIKKFLQGKSFSTPIQYLQEVSKHLQKIITHTTQITENITYINDMIPIIKALLKKKDREGNIEQDPLLNEITEALKDNIQQPKLSKIKELLAKENVNLEAFDNKLKFEHLNDVSDKLIGVLNDKLLLVIGISEVLIAGVEDDGMNDVDASQRLPDELRVLFLASRALDIFCKIKEVRSSIKIIFNSAQLFLRILESGKLGVKIDALLRGGNDSVQHIVVNNTKHLKRLTPVISEVATNLDALDLKLKLNTLDLNKIIRMAYGLIYEKTFKTWQSPFDI